MSKASIHKGDIFNTNFFGRVIVVSYRDFSDIIVKFSDGTLVPTRAHELRHGQVRNPNHPIVCGVGFRGEGVYPRAKTNTYNVWNNMLRRCYMGGNINYIDCTVEKRWHNFQNFAYDLEHMVGFWRGDWQLDKDILKRGNRMYSKNTCCLVPPYINKIMANRDGDSRELPVGVYLKVDKSTVHNPYKAITSIYDKQVHLGTFSTPEKAFMAYKLAKEAEVKRIANIYKWSIDHKVYVALMKYRVLITD